VCCRCLSPNIAGAGLFVAFISKITEHRRHSPKHHQAKQP